MIKNYGEYIEVNKDLLDQGNYDCLFEFMKEEWRNFPISMRLFIMVWYKLPNKFKKWAYT
jgi:hypothetical protein